MPITLTVQREIDLASEQGSGSLAGTLSEKLPTDEQLLMWLNGAQIDPLLNIELNLRIVSKDEIKTINKTYRGIDKATNVLSFASQVPDGPDLDVIGDIVICADIIAEEAIRYQKTLSERWAHMLVHGFLHVQGFDHEEPDEREYMESEEIRILKGLGIFHPYQLN